MIPCVADANTIGVIDEDMAVMPEPVKTLRLGIEQVKDVACEDMIVVLMRHRSCAGDITQGFQRLHDFTRIQYPDWFARDLVKIGRGRVDGPLRCGTGTVVALVGDVGDIHYRGCGLVGIPAQPACR